MIWKCSVIYINLSIFIIHKNGTIIMNIVEPILRIFCILIVKSFLRTIILSFFIMNGWFEIVCSLYEFMNIYNWKMADWPRSLMCSEVKLRPASIVPGWVTTQVFIDESSPRIKVFLNQPLQNANGYSCRCSRVKMNKK